MLAISGVSHSYGKKQALKEVSFGVPEGRFGVLLGPNGAGKSTLYALLTQLLPVQSGSLSIAGHEVAGGNLRALADLGIVFQSQTLDLDLTVLQNLTVYAELYGVADARGRVGELADRLDIADLLDRPAGKLSAGQKTRVALAKALVNRPDLLLLDEPTASLDPDTGDWVRRYLEEYRDETGATILLASHNMAEVERLCDDVLMLRAGRIVDRGSPRDLLAKYGRRTMEDVFLDIARDRRSESLGEEVPA